MNKKYESTAEQITLALINGNQQRAVQLMIGLPFEVREKLLRAGHGLVDLSKSLLPGPNVIRIEDELSPKSETLPAVATPTETGGEQI